MGKGSGGGSAPPAPSADQSIKTQARYNAIDTHTPYSVTTFERDADGIPTASHTTMRGEVQDLYNQGLNQQRELMKRADQMIGYLPSNQFNINAHAPDRAMEATNTWDLGSFDPTDQVRRVDTSQLSDFGTATNHVDADRLRAITDQGDDISQAIYDRRMQQMNPDWEQMQRDQEIRLAERGIPVSSEVWNDQMDRQDASRREMLIAASNEADMARGAEQQRLYGMEANTQGMLSGEDQRLLEAANYQRAAQLGEQQAMAGEDSRLLDAEYRERQQLVNEQAARAAEQNRLIAQQQSARDRAIQEQLLERGQQFNEASILMGGSPVMGNFNIGATPSVGYTPPDVQSAYNAEYNANANAWNAQQQQQSSWRNGLFGIGSGLLSGGFF